MRKVKTTVKIREELCIEKKAGPCGIVIFGASGDLTHRKLLPALFNLYKRKLLPDEFYFLGFARSSIGEQAFREKVCESLAETAEGAASEKIGAFVKRCFYLSGDYDDGRAYKRLAQRLEEIERKYCDKCSCVFYLSTPPQVAGPIVKGLDESGLTAEEDRGTPKVRVVIEKPFGRDLESARKLNEEMHHCLTERQIYRIDHYLGKETVQNIMMLRFANSIFEPVWNRDYVDHVQITVAESLGVEHRAGYYEKSGLLRDMFQNHIMQLLTLVAMEPPLSFEADRIRDEKVKVLRAIRPFPLDDLENWIVRGQYAPGHVDGKEVVAYIDEQGVAPDSRTETFVAARMMIDNWRWHGIPFYLRSGKRLPKRISEVAITFKRLPHSVFAPIRGEDIPANVLVLTSSPTRELPLRPWRNTPGPGYAWRPLPWISHIRMSSKKNRPAPTNGSSSTPCSATRRCSFGRTQWKSHGPFSLPY